MFCFIEFQKQFLDAYFPPQGTDTRNKNITYPKSLIHPSIVAGFLHQQNIQHA